MKIDQNDLQTAEQIENETRAFVPSLNIVYSSTISNRMKREEPTEGWKRGGFSFNYEQFLAGPLHVIPVSYRGVLKATDSSNDAKATFYNPTQTPDGAQGMHSGAAVQKFLTENEEKGYKVDKGVDLLVWVKELEDYAVIYFKGNVIKNWTKICNLGESGNYVKIDSKEFEVKRGEWFQCIGTDSGEKAPELDAEKKEATVAVYQKLNKKED